MKEKEYLEIVKKNSEKENIILDVFIAFIIGGLIGVLAEGTSSLLRQILEIPIDLSYIYTSVIFVIIASFFTGLGFFDKIVSFCKAGLTIPITGFAHSMTCTVLDYRKEGFTKGIGSNIFKLTGCIILYTIVFSFIVALIKGVLV